ncbi:Swt1 family HEPN domain-containing protein, partial [Hominilimicola sp.]|uniref:Swt1 family HEPN domain-containing protein n=1 Tax=Hominilimicola sp. TaxID=3073571 RepID=UPI00307BD244
RWHAQRGDSLINYTEFGDLASIMNNNLELFSDHIVSIEWARNIISTIERSRNVIMHSGELSPRDIERIGINIRDWISQVGV